MAPAAGSLPRAALGSVVIYAATRLDDIADLRRIARFRRREFVLSLATTAAVLTLGALYGVGAAMPRISRPRRWRPSTRPRTLSNGFC